MLEHLETLEAVFIHKTMSKAATSLHVTQSAVSKRIAQLEYDLGKKLIERQGRHIQLTAEAINIVNRTLPLLNELKSVITEEYADKNHSLNFGMSETLLASWGAKLLAKAATEFPQLTLFPHAHRSPVVVDKVRSGEYLLGISAGKCYRAPDLSYLEIGQEEMVIVLANLKGKSKDLLAIDEYSETWQAIKQQVKQSKLVPTHRLESFFAMAQIANQGVMDALVPIGVASALNISAKKIQRTKIARPIVLIGRKTTLQRESLKAFIEYTIFESATLLNVAAGQHRRLVF